MQVRNIPFGSATGLRAALLTLVLAAGGCAPVASQGAGTETKRTFRTVQELGGMTGFPLPTGQPVEAGVGPDFPKLEDGSHYLYFVFEATRTRHTEVVLRSPDFEPHLVLQRLDGEMLVDVQQAAGTDGEARVRLAGPGIYLVYATSRRPGATGRFTLLVEERGVLTPATSTPLVLEQPLHGELSAHDALLTDGAPYDDWTFQVEEGESYRLTIRAELDVAVMLGIQVGDAVWPLFWEDDLPAALTSEVAFRTIETATYVIRVAAVAPGGTGSYTLMLDRD